MYNESGRELRASSDAPPMLEDVEARSDHPVIAEANVVVVGKCCTRCCQEYEQMMHT